MKGRPWYKRFPADFLHGVMALSLEEKGAYSICLDLMYDHGGPIPDDGHWIARVCGCPLQRWRKIRASLIAAGKLNLTIEGRLSNGRAVYEMHRSRHETAEQSAAGCRGGRPSKSQVSEQQPSDINDIADTEVPPPANTNETENLQETFNKVAKNFEVFEREDSENNELAFTDKKQSQKLRVKKERTSTRIGKGGTRGERIPEDWQPSDADRAYAVKHQVDPDMAAEEFRNFWLSATTGATKLDWSRTFQNRVLWLQEARRFRLVAEPPRRSWDGLTPTTVSL